MSLANIYKCHSITMSSQKNLMSFFKPLPKKRSSSEANFSTFSTDKCDDTGNVLKKKKVNEESINETLKPDPSCDSVKPSIVDEEFKSEVSDSKDNQTENNIKSIGKDLKPKTDENDPNVLSGLLSTPPNSKSSQEKTVMSPFGMLTPLQSLARIKSQCAKTPALHHSIGSTWFFALHSEFQKPYFSKVRFP